MLLLLLWPLGHCLSWPFSPCSEPSGPRCQGAWVYTPGHTLPRVTRLAFRCLGADSPLPGRDCPACCTAPACLLAATSAQGPPFAFPYCGHKEHTHVLGSHLTMSACGTGQLHGGRAPSRGQGPELPTPSSPPFCPLAPCLGVPTHSGQSMRGAQEKCLVLCPGYCPVLQMPAGVTGSP